MMNRERAVTAISASLYMFLYGTIAVVALGPSPELDAGPFAADVASFWLHLAAENKVAGTIRIYTEADRLPCFTA
jgi:hypothetical protein